MSTPDYLARFQARVVQDAWLDAWGATWERRATALEAARPRPGDYHGRASRTDLRTRHDQLTAAADSCRARGTGADGYAHTTLADAADALRSGTPHRLTIVTTTGRRTLCEAP